MGRAEAISHGAGLGDIAAGNRGHHAVLSVLNGRHHQIAADPRGRQDSKAQHKALHQNIAGPHHIEPLGPAQWTQEYLALEKVIGRSK